jgi:hypothetical protein
VTIETLEEMHWEVLSHPACSPDLVPSNFHLFGPLKEALGGKIFIEPTVKLLCNNGWMSCYKLWGGGGIMKLSERSQQCIEMQEEYIEKYVLFKKIVFNFHLKKVWFVFEPPLYLVFSVFTFRPFSLLIHNSFCVFLYGILCFYPIYYCQYRPGADVFHSVPILPDGIL